MRLYWYARLAVIFACVFFGVYAYGLIHFIFTDFFNFALYAFGVVGFWFMNYLDRLCEKKEQEENAHAQQS